MQADIQTATQNSTDAKLIGDVTHYIFRPDIRKDYPGHSAALPDFVRFVFWAQVIDLEISNSGIGLLLDRFGQHFDEWIATFDQFKCPTMLSYLDETRALFPRGEIPEDEDERWECLDEIEFTLREVDRKHANAIGEITQVLRHVIDSEAVKYNQQIEAFWRDYSVKP